MQLDEIPDPLLRAGHVIAEILCVQPSVTEAQLAYGIRTLAYEQIKNRLETEAPIQLFGHEFCARIVEANEGARLCPGDRVSCSCEIAVWRMLPVSFRIQISVPTRADYWVSTSGLLL